MTRKNSSDMTLEGKDWPQPSKCSMSWALRGSPRRLLSSETGPQQWGTSNRMLLPFGLCQRYGHILSLFGFCWFLQCMGQMKSLVPTGTSWRCSVTELYISVFRFCIWLMLPPLVLWSRIFWQQSGGLVKQGLDSVECGDFTSVSRVFGPQAGGRRLMVCIISQPGVPVEPAVYSRETPWAAAHPTFWASATLTKDHELALEQRKPSPQFKEQTMCQQGLFLVETS